jgi:hypothetical protein
MLHDMDFDLSDSSLNSFLWVILAATSRFITRENAGSPVCGYDFPAQPRCPFIFYSRQKIHRIATDVSR